MKSDAYTRMTKATIDAQCPECVKDFQRLVCLAIKVGIVIPDSDTLLKMGQGLAPNDDFKGFERQDDTEYMRYCMLGLSLLYQLAVVKERM